MLYENNYSMVTISWEMTFIYFMGLVLSFTARIFMFILAIPGKLQFTAG